MVGRHRPFSPPRWWSKPLLVVAAAVAGYIGGHLNPPSATPMSVNSQEAKSDAQRLAIDVLGQCNVTPQALTTQQCGEAAEVASEPIHDGKDGLNGINGVPGVNGIDGHDGKDGRDGSDVKANIVHHADGTSEYCPRTSGTDRYPVFDCVKATIVPKPTSSN